VEAVERVKGHPRTRDIFAYFHPPWFRLETADEYRELFERFGFKVILARMRTVKTRHTPDEVFKIFSSAAATGYLNQDNYDIELADDFIESFKTIVKNAFIRQADDQGMVTLVFNRIFLIAFKM
jgi:trans-aconitate methyltransferase